MIPVIATGLLLLLTALRSEEPTAKPTAPKPNDKQPIPVFVHRPVSKPKPAFKPTPSTFLRTPPPTNPQYTLAELFLQKYTKQSHIGQGVWVEDAMSYQQTYATTPTSHRRVPWHICQIRTLYDNIYLSLQLNDDGSIPADTQGVLISYDRPEVEVLLTQLPDSGFNCQAVVTSEKLLRFFLGDARRPYTVARAITSPRSY